MIFDKVTALIEHQDNGKFSVFYCKAGSNEWFKFLGHLDFQEAKYWVKLIKVAFQLRPDLNERGLDLRVLEMSYYVYHVDLTSRELTASKLFKIFSNIQNKV